jgi:histone deacetylase complex regulatory component SIN3
MRELRVEDALLYLDQVKVEFGDRPHIYNEFLDIMKTFKTHQIDTPGVIRRVSNLFHGNKKLVLGFNTFLPEGYKIELPLDGDGPPVAVFRAPGETITHILSGPGAPPIPEPQKPAAAPPGGANFPSHGAQGPLRAGPTLGLGAQGLGMRGGPLGQQQAGLGGGAAPGAPAGYPPAALHLQQQGANAARALGQPPQMMGAAEQAGQIPGRASMPAAGRAGLPGMGQAQQPGADAKPPPQQRAQPQPPQQPQAAQQGQEQPQQPGMEFDHAINYVTTIKKRFANEPETYKKFLEILHTYQKEQRGIKEVLEEVSVLFSEHPDLLKEFTFFLPDAVQSEAKAQLEQAANEAVARNKARAQAQAAAAQQASGIPQAAQSAQLAAPLQVSAQDQHAPPPAVRPTNPIPFGAAMGRSKEREHEIFRSVVYGSISFKPIRPPRKSMPTVAQNAAKNGRPSVLPRLQVIPNTAETDFFEKAKMHLNRKELAAERPSATRVRHTPHMEFLKCLHLFGAGVLNKEELMLLLRGLFMQGHAPKSGINVGGGASNPAIANDAHGLLKDLEEVSDAALLILTFAPSCSNLSFSVDSRRSWSVCRPASQQEMQT